MVNTDGKENNATDSIENHAATNHEQTPVAQDHSVNELPERDTSYLTELNTPINAPNESDQKDNGHSEEPPKKSTADETKTENIPLTDERLNARLAPPGYWPAFHGELGVLNVFAFIGAIFIFILPPLGLIFSWIGYLNSKYRPEDKLGRFLSLLGIAVSGAISLFFIFTVAFLIFFSILNNFWMFSFLHNM